MIWWVGVIIVVVALLVAYDMYRQRYMLYGAFGWGKKQGKNLRKKQKYKNVRT